MRSNGQACLLLIFALHQASGPHSSRTHNTAVYCHILTVLHLAKFLNSPYRTGQESPAEEPAPLLPLSTLKLIQNPSFRVLSLLRSLHASLSMFDHYCCFLQLQARWIRLHSQYVLPIFCLFRKSSFFESYPFFPWKNGSFLLFMCDYFRQGNYFIFYFFTEFICALSYFTHCSFVCFQFFKYEFIVLFFFFLSNCS